MWISYRVDSWRRESEESQKKWDLQMFLESEAVDLTFQTLGLHGVWESEQPLCEDSLIREVDQVQLKDEKKIHWKD